MSAQAKATATIPDLKEQLRLETEKHEALLLVAERLRERSGAMTPGGLVGYDSALLSGVRRKPDHKADRSRQAAYDRESAAWASAAAQEEVVSMVAHRLAVAEKIATLPEVTPELLADAKAVRDRFGWHLVARVNAKSVTVETAYSWTDRIPHDQILEVKK